MTDSEADAPRLREKTIFLLACGGILLLLGLMLGLVLAKKDQAKTDDVQSGDAQGVEQALVVVGDVPRVITAETEFEIRAQVTNAGFDTLRDITLTMGAQALIMPVPEGTSPTIRIDVLPAGESRELVGTLKAIEPGRTSIAAHAKDGSGRVAAGRYWDIEVSDGPVSTPQYLPGALMALRISTFGPATVDPQRPFEITAVIENSGQVVLESLTLNVRAGDGVKALYAEALDYPVEQLVPGSARMVRARFKMNKPVARGQVHVYAADAKGWVAGVGLHEVSTQR